MRNRQTHDPSIARVVAANWLVLGAQHQPVRPHQPR